MRSVHEIMPAAKLEAHGVWSREMVLWSVLVFLFLLVRPRALSNRKQVTQLLSLCIAKPKQKKVQVTIPLPPGRDQFEWQKEEPLKLRPYKPKTFMTMSIKQSSPSSLVVIDKNHFTRMNLRHRLLRAAPRSTVQAYDHAKPAVAELYTYLTQQHLPLHYPTIFRLDSSQTKLTNTVTNEVFPTCTASLSPTEVLHLLGRLVDEDFMMLLPSPDGDGYSLQAFVVCYSSGFGIQGVLGKKLRELHARVPGYAEKISKSMDRYFGKLEPGKYMERANWTIVQNGELAVPEGQNHLYGSEAAAVQNEAVNINDTYLRTERQLVHKLPASGAIVFSFKTYLYPISEIKAEGPEEAEALATAIDGLREGNVPEMHRYKRAGVWGEAVKAFLRSS